MVRRNPGREGREGGGEGREGGRGGEGREGGREGVLKSSVRLLHNLHGLWATRKSNFSQQICFLEQQIVKGGREFEWNHRHLPSGKTRQSV